MKAIIHILFLALPASLFSQTAREWTLQECISHALAHNLTIRQQQDNVELQEIQLSTARNSRLPNLSGGAGENFGFGRSLTTDNTYANRNTQSTSFNLSTSVPLITGGQIPQEINIRRLNLQAALQDARRTEESVTLNVVSAFLESVYQKDMAQIAQRQVELSRMQVHRLELLFKNDKASEADLAQIRSTEAQDELSLTQQQNAFMLSLLDLSQLLELPSPEGFDVQRPLTEKIDDQWSLPSPDAVYAEALGIKPQIQAEQLRLQSARKNVLLARSSHLPSLYFSAGLGSSYYNTSGYPVESFGRQMKNNFSQSLGFSLSIPIFNRFTTRNSIRAAKVQVHSQELQLEQTKKQLYKEIQQAYYNAVASQRQCLSAQTALESAQTAHELTQRKYENGKATVTEYQEAKTALMRAESNAAQARYTFLFRQKILEFYRTSRIDP